MLSFLTNKVKTISLAKYLKSIRISNRKFYILGLKVKNKFFYAALLSSLFVSGCSSRNDTAPVVTYSSASTNKDSKLTSAKFQEETTTFSSNHSSSTTIPETTAAAPETTEHKQTAPFAESLPKAQEQPQVAETETAINTETDTPPQTTEAAVTEDAEQPAVQQQIAEAAIEPESAPAPAPKKTGRWVWPTQGKVIQDFKGDKHTNKGIEIGGSVGTPIHSADEGTVIYQGSGIKGYGKMVVIKHSDGYVTAYAHNDDIVVKEGDTVKQGQKIATMGKSGADQVKLHFEIRRNGRPIDPMQELPE